jgi:hypothetical protein
MRVLAAALALPALLATPACDNCGAPERCTFATLLLFVHDAGTGDPLPEAMVTQSGAPIGTDLTFVTCAAGQCTHAVSPGAGQVTISLQGYRDAVIDFVPHHDACGDATRQAVDVGMRPTTDAMSPLLTGPTYGASGCN